MNSGSFFRIDLEASKVVSGITFFNYIDLPDLDVSEDNVKYPIRLAISAECISILTHYYSEDRPHHVEEVIINLPYGTKDAEGLSSAIKHLYNTPFPLSDYLYNLVKKRYTNEAPEGSGYDYMRQSPINKDSYSALTIWGLLNKEKNRINLLNKKGQITKFLRKLLLDFMFDLMHSDVFECSKYYSQMREGLLSDFFFSSIIKKSEYYYYRRIIRSRFIGIHDTNKYLQSYSKNYKLSKDERRNQLDAQKDIINSNLSLIEEQLKCRLEKSVDSKLAFFQRYELKKLKKRHTKFLSELNSIEEHYNTNDILDSIKNLYTEKLDEAESIWIDTIMSSMADQHFTFSPEWFENQKTRKKRREFCVSDSWFVDPEEEMARVVFPLEENDEEKSSWKRFLSEIKRLLSSNNTDQRIHYLNSFALSELIGSIDNSSVLKRNSKISKWFYGRFDFDDTFRMHLFNYWNQFFALLLLILGIVAFAPCFWRCPRNIALFPITAAIVFLLTAGWLAISNHLSKNTDTIDVILLMNRSHIEIKKSCRYALILMLLGVSLFFSNIYCEWWQLLLVTSIIFVGGILLLCLTHPKTHIIDNIHLLLPRLVASMTAAWIMLIIGNDIVKEYLSIPLCIIITLIVFMFIIYEIDKAIPNLSKRGLIFRSLELMLISFSIALIVGVFAIDILSPSLLADAKNSLEETFPYTIEVPQYYDWEFLAKKGELTLKIIPSYLIKFSFLAMFIGVFIQMIFEEKKITEI